MKRALFFFPILMFFCFSLPVNAADNPYNTYYDHSELDWYISQTVGPDAAAQCHYYDYYPDAEEAILLAQRPTTSGIDVMYIHGCNAGVYDWYNYDNLVLEATGVEQTGYTPDGREILKYTFSGPRSQFSLFLTKTDNGLLDKVMMIFDEDLSSWQEFQEFIYDSDGCLLQANTGTATYYGLFFDELENKSVDEAYCFSYNPDQSLSQLAHFYLDEWESDGSQSGNAVFFYDENGVRTSIQSATEMDRGEMNEIIFLRDPAGHVLNAQSTDNNGNQRSIDISYLPGGKTKYNNEYVEPDM